tara:strand:- start:42 stop:323 length:282 start_codon:yes stop_codon:yes gene_type:complete
MAIYIEQAINRLAVAQDDTLRYSIIGFCNTEEDFNNINGVENFDFTWADVQAKAVELEQEDTDKKDNKVSAYRKNGLTDEEILAIDSSLEDNL